MRRREGKAFTHAMDGPKAMHQQKQPFASWPYKVGFVCVAFAACALLAYANGWSNVASHKAESRRPSGPRYEVIGGAEVVWQVPAKVLPKGVLFVAHGCNHGAVDFWHRARGCPKCVGLPEEMLITNRALDRGYAVVAVSSVDREGSRCWTLPGIRGGGAESEIDVKQVKQVLSTLLPRETLQHLPVYALGASSGGAFVLLLAAHLKLAGVCSQIMALPSDILEPLLAGATDKAVPYPPAMFVHMTRDERTAAYVKQDVELLSQRGIPAKEVQVAPAALTPSYLSDVAPHEISVDQSKAIHAALKADGFLDSAGLLVEDPRSSGWRASLANNKVPGFESLRLKADLSAIAEELNLLYAQHEIIAATTGEMFDWFESSPVRTYSLLGGKEA